MPSTRIHPLAAALLIAVLPACTSAGAGGGMADTIAMPAPAEDSATVELVRAAAIPITGAETDYDALMALIGDARFVLLGEATHGTQEFYAERARITRRLIDEKGFSAVAIEGEWPDAEGVHRFARGGGAATAEAALRGFQSGFPQWMWANTAIRDLVVWLQEHNAGRPEADRVGFYGLDVYSLFESADSVVAWLRRVDPAAAEQARRRYACLDRHGDDPQAYGAAVLADESRSCEDEAAEQVAALEQRYAARTPGADARAEDELFSALQHARAVQAGEAYFRVLYHGGPASWNARDAHMAQTLEHLVDHLEARGQTPKVVVWAHNTHSGDARLTQMGEGGEHNVGQLMRERYGAQSVLVGFTTYTGRVLAAEEWDAPGRVRDLRPARPDSYSGLFHRTGIPAFLLPFRGNDALRQALARPRLERAVGVVYAPQTELQSHYFYARLGEQFDAVIHVDSTTAVTPLPMR
jgi:erythromycin esterase-like protein